MSRAYVARGEDRILDEAARASAAGSYVTLSDGVTHYRLAGPGTGPLVLLTPGITIPLGYWDAIRRRSARGWPAHAGLQRLRPRVVRPHRGPLRPGSLRPPAGRTPQCRRSRGAGAPGGHVHGRAPGHGSRDTAPCPGAAVPDPDRSRRPERPAAATDPPTGRRSARPGPGHALRAPTPRQPSGTQRALAPGRRAAAPPRRRAVPLFHGSIHALLSTLRDFPLAARHDLYRRAGRLPVPKLLLWGRHDRVTPIDQLESVRELFQPGDSQLFDHCGHMVPFEDPHGTARLLAAFFRTITGERSA